MNKAACTIGESDGVCCAKDQIFELPADCGHSVDDRIAHGNESAVFQYPWAALLFFRDTVTNKLEGQCGGSLINERYVITAAHCLKNPAIDASIMEFEYVRLGEHTISNVTDCNTYTDTDSGAVEFDCAGPVENVPYESIIVHPQYVDAYQGNDIALIRLARKVEFKDHIKAICLPMSPQLKSLLLPEYIVAGWGLTETLERSNVLMKAKIPLVDHTQCQERFDPFKRKYNITISSKQICVGAVNRVDSCRGDSGGPLMWFQNYMGSNRFVLFGVVSFGVKDCGKHNLPGVYVRVGSYLVWIVANMKA